MLMMMMMMILRYCVVARHQMIVMDRKLIRKVFL
jgi:hypothetical protein